MQREMIMGSCDGTGAAIYVCLGFVPRFVKVFNLEDAGSLFPSVEWWDGMAVISAFDEGVKEVVATSGAQRSALASAGISAYAGGEKLTYDGVTNSRWEYGAAASDAGEVFVDGHYMRDASGDAAFKNVGDALLGRTPTAADHGAVVYAPKGFIIGTDADLNVNGEQLLWMAIP